MDGIVVLALNKKSCVCANNPQHLNCITTGEQMQGNFSVFFECFTQ